MSAALFGIQRAVGEELLAAGWHASSIATASRPGSAWVLFDPSRRIRVRMCADLADVMAEATAACLPRRRPVSPPWTLTIHRAPASVVASVLRSAIGVSEGGTGRDRRAIAHALAEVGMRPDRSRLLRALSGTASWFSPCREAETVWTAPYRTDAGGWTVVTSAVHLDATPGTPAAVLVPLINAVDPEAGAEA